MLGLQPFFANVANNGITRDLREQIFSYLIMKYSCVTLAGTSEKYPKAAVQKGWTKGCISRFDPLPYHKTDMLGICMGPYNKLIVLDIDNVQVFNEFMNDYNLIIPDTFTVQTGRGFHYYFIYPDNGKNYPGKEYPHCGFETKGNNRCVAAPSSSHPNGAYYKPINWHEIVPMPNWMYALYDNTSYISKVLESIRRACKIAELKNYIELKQKYGELLPMAHQSTPNPLENPFRNAGKKTATAKPEIQELLNQSPTVRHRSEPIMSALLALKNAGYSDEQARNIMLSAPLGEKLRERGDQLIKHELASANNYIQANPPKKQKINIVSEAYEIMRQLDYVKDTDDELYCRIIQSATRTEYIKVKSDSFYGIICKLLLKQFKKTISATQFKPLLTALIEDKRLSTPTVPSICRFYQDKDKLIYDLGRDDYQCIEITSSGVKQIPHPDLILERSDLTLPIDNVDLLNGDNLFLEMFWDLCEIKTDYQRHFLNIVILSYLFNNVNSPILYFYGQHGSGKTRLALSIKGIFDPWNEGAVLPTKIDNFRLLLNQSGIGFIDNFSVLKSDILNDLCMSYSGGLVYNRQLFKDKKGLKFSIKCPMILASINIPSKLPEDFISRTAFIKIKPKKYQLPEIELNNKLNSLYPKIRGLFFNLASKILPIMNTYKPTNLTRHADLDMIGQAYCDIVKTSLKYETIIQKVNLDSAFSVIDDEPAIRKFVEIVSEKKFISFTMSEMSRMISEEDNFRINDAKLGKDLKYYGTILNQLHIKLYAGDKLSNGARPYVAFIDHMKNIPDNIDCYKLQVSPEYVTEIFLHYHKTETGQVIDVMLDNS